MDDASVRRLLRCGDLLPGMRAALVDLSAGRVVQPLRTVLDLRPDVAVVDVGLPGMTGLELAKRSRGAGFAGLMIAVSGYGREQDVRQARESGFDAHLVKPVNVTELQRLMGSAA